VDTGELLKAVELTPAESLYLAAQAGSARGFGGSFLAEKCGIYVITKEDVARSSSPIPTEKWMLAWEAQQVPVTIAPLYKPAGLIGLEVRAMAEKASLRPGESGAESESPRKTVGEAGIYLSSIRLQPSAVVVFTGLWDAVSACWDALQNGSEDRYVFASVPDGASAAVLKDTLENFFPGVPRLMVSDQDPSGQKSRKKFAKVCTMAILPGAGLAKDYREADPKKRWPALLDGIERALDQGNPTGDETGPMLIARRLFEGAMRGKQMNLRDLEAWRFGQRCAGICKATTGGKRYFAIRARVYGQTPLAEGLHDFDPLLNHPAFARVRQDYPSLASIISGGPTESPMSPQWTPPVFVEDGRHWTEIPPQDRKDYAVNRGWEPWPGRDIGSYDPDDLREALGQVTGAFTYTILPGAPSSEVGLRVFMFALSAALCALRTEEMWHAGQSVGFLPWVWFYGEPGTGKGSASKMVAAMVSGETRTYGSQRFGGEREASWLTESVLHLPVAFKDELDQFLDHSALEDLKTYISGEALQKRKAYGTDMTLAPRPVVFATNEIKVNSDDGATKERIILMQLDKNKNASDTQRNNVLETFHNWMKEEGASVLHRVCIHFYKRFRVIPIGKSRFTRSAMFDTAVAMVCRDLKMDVDQVMRPSAENREAAILHGSPWFRMLADYATHDLVPNLDTQHAAACEVWGINPSNESEIRKLRRYLDAFQDAAKGTDGVLQVNGINVYLSSMQSSAAKRTFVFSRRLNEAAS